MSRRRDKPLDIYKRLQVVRTIEDLIYDEDAGTFEKSKAMESDFFKATSVVKKKLNIPVTDIAQDYKYDDDNAFSSAFVLPASYVRHIKIMGDEADMTVDYCIEDEDIAWLHSNAKVSVDAELKATITHSLFEGVFDILEKNTGFSDPITMQMATPLVCHHLQLPVPLATKVMQELYPYWISKRNKMHKPLNRKYWPATAPNDTNPHLVFRPREKERYRLRRHHKNDLQSFRKMQSLRREFARARVLMELVLEREMLKKANMEISGEIFEQHLRNVSEKAGGAGKEILVPSTNIGMVVPPEGEGEVKVKTEREEGDKLDGELMDKIFDEGTRSTSSSTVVPSVDVDPFRYQFRFPHLIPMLEPPKKIVAPPPVYYPLTVESQPKLKLTLKIKPPKAPKAARAEPVVKETREEKASRKKKAKAEALPRGRKRDRAGFTKDGQPLPEGAVPTKPPKVPVVKEKKPPKEAKPKKEKEPKEKKELKDKENASNKKVIAAAQVMQPLGGRITIDTKGRMVLHPNQHGNTKVDASGSSEILLNERLGRMKESMWPTFMDELNTREKVYAPRSLSEYMSDLDLSEEDAPPSRFRLRGRIGRGGRVVMDRIPIYDRCHDPESWQAQTNLRASRSSAHSVSNHYDYIYPTTLQPARHQEHVKMFASHFRKEAFYRAGLPQVLQPECSADITSIFPLAKSDIDAIDIEDILGNEKIQELSESKDASVLQVETSAIHSLSSGENNVMTAASTSGKIKPALLELSDLPAPVVISSVGGDVEEGINNTPMPNDDANVTDIVAGAKEQALLNADSLTVQTDPAVTNDLITVKQEECLSPSSVEENNSAIYNGSVDNTISSFPEVQSSEYQSKYKYNDDLTMYALLVPPERDALFSLPSHREQDLFRLSDQRPKDPRADPQLHFTLQANQLVAREDESAESIISIPRRFRCPTVNTPSPATSASKSESTRSSMNSSKSVDTKSSTLPVGCTGSSTDATAPTTSVSELDTTTSATEAMFLVEPAPAKYVFFV